MKIFDNEKGVLSVEVSVKEWHKVMDLVTSQAGLYRVYKHLGDDGVAYSTGVEWNGENNAFDFTVTKFDASENGEEWSVSNPVITKKRFASVISGMKYLESEKALPKRKALPEWWESVTGGIKNTGPKVQV